MLYKPNPDKPMRQMTLPTIDGKSVTVSGSNNRWQMIVVYRGLHCPICKTYTAKIEALKDKFDELETDIVFISGDTAEKAKNFASEVGLNLPVAYDLSIEQMRQLGLYISEPRPNETDRPFPQTRPIHLEREGPTTYRGNFKRTDHSTRTRIDYSRYNAH